MAAENKIVLIDGHSILNRAYYGIPVLTNSQGLHTNAVYGFLNIMFKVLDEEQAGYLAVAFDLKAPTFRHKMYEAYKGTRKPMPQELQEQVPVMKEMLRAMEVPIMELEGFEADDILGTVARQMQKDGMEVSILSGDRDLLQLATDRIQIRIPKTKAGGTEIENYFAEDVRKRYQVTPRQFLDVKALMGDASDNIPGVPGIGEKTATRLIAQYGSLEEVCAHVEEIAQAKPREALKNHQDLAWMSWKLAKIDTQAPYILKKEEARIGTLATSQARELLRRLEFKNLLSRFEAQEGEKPSSRLFSYRIVTKQEEAASVFSQAEGKEAAFWIAGEEGELLGAALCFDPEEVWYFEPGERLERDYLEKGLAKLAERAPCFATLHLKEQLDFLPLREADRGCLFDGAVAAYLVNPLKEYYGCDDIAREYLEEILPAKSELLGKESLKAARQNVREAYLEYVCRHGWVMLKALESMRSRLRETGMDRLFEEIEMPLLFVLYEMEKEGIAVEAGQLKEYGEQLSGRISQLEGKIWEAAGEQFNINSPKQLGTVLFEKLRLPHGKKTKTGYSTAADVLEGLAGEYPIVSEILEYRQLTKLKSTYADGLAAYISPDGRIHGTFNQTVTATGRLSSTEPNLQNIPIRMELGRLIRKVFVPKEGYLFADADYSQIELRVLAHFSDDENLIGAYRDARDIHRITASQVFHVPEEEVTPLLRRNAKAVNFGIVYGISSFGLSQDLSITRKEAQEYIEQYFKTYPGVKKFLDQTVEDAKRDGYVTTLYGRRRPVPELKSSNFMQRSFGERVAMNSPIQGTAADIIKIAMLRVSRALKERNLKSKLILQVHDELLVETAAEEEEEVKAILREEMQNAASLKVKLEVDLHTGRNWYEAK